MTRFAGVALSAVLCICAYAADEAKVLDALAARMKVPAATAARLDQDPGLEAAPDLAKWGGPFALGYLDGRADKVPVTSEGYFATAGGKLFVALRCSDPDMPSVTSAPEPLDGNVWKGDSLEVFLLPGLDSTQDYFQFAVNPAGSLFDAHNNDKSWNSGAVVKVFRDDASWTAVIAVPLSAMLPKDAAAPALWRVNLNRSRTERTGLQDLDLAWSPTLSKSNHVPGRFGLAWLKDAGAAPDFAAANASLDQIEKIQIVLAQDFSKDIAPFSDGKPSKGESPWGEETFLHLKGQNQTRLERNFGPIQGLHMAFAYRTAAHQHGLVVQGSGTVVRATRPAVSEVLGRGLKLAQETCNDADHQTTAKDLGFDAFLFKRPYGH